MILVVRLGQLTDILFPESKVTHDNKLFQKWWKLEVIVYCMHACLHVQ
jgi:hypothetical protein